MKPGTHGEEARGTQMCFPGDNSIAGQQRTCLFVIPAMKNNENGVSYLLEVKCVYRNVNDCKWGLVCYALHYWCVCVQWTHKQFSESYI